MSLVVTLVAADPHDLAAAIEAVEIACVGTGAAVSDGDLLADDWIVVDGKAAVN